MEIVGLVTSLEPNVPKKIFWRIIRCLSLSLSSRRELNIILNVIKMTDSIRV